MVWLSLFKLDTSDSLQSSMILFIIDIKHIAIEAKSIETITIKYAFHDCHKLV